MTVAIITAGKTEICTSSIVTASDLGQGLADMLFGLEFKIGRQDTVYSVIHIGSVNKSLSLFTPIHRGPAFFSILSHQEAHASKIPIQDAASLPPPFCQEG